MQQMVESAPFIHRLLQPTIEDALADTPVVCLLGARQAGKSTLAGMFSERRVYITLDDQNLLQAATFDPVGFVRQLPDKVTID